MKGHMTMLDDPSAEMALLARGIVQSALSARVCLQVPAFTYPRTLQIERESTHFWQGYASKRGKESSKVSLSLTRPDMRERVTKCKVVSLPFLCGTSQFASQAPSALSTRRRKLIADTPICCE